MVVSNRWLNQDHALLELRAGEILDHIEPGQFANILADKSPSVFLRRPFSIYKADYRENTISFLIKAIGEGTRSIAATQPGEMLSVIFPLGRGYSMPEEKSRVLLVGGGVGIASLLILAEELKKAGHLPEVLLGARSSKDLVDLDLFAMHATVHISTEDGSMGVRGFVTAHPVMTQHLSDYSRIYACGPDPMMKAVGSMALHRGIACEVSLENTMACGYGVCLCCVTPTIHGHKCVCTEGPVFDIKELGWQN